MDFIIDVQGFKDTEECFLPKEVAVVVINDAHCGHWIIAQPYAFTELPHRSKSQNNWLTKYFHGIEWFEGDTPYKNLCRHLRSITRLSNRIFVRGKDKADLLHRITSRNIINLEDDKACPSFNELPQVQQHCLVHAIKSKTENKEYTCALNNALRLNKWIKDCGYLDFKFSTPLTSPPPSPALSITWSNREERHQNDKEKNVYTNDSWWI